MERLLLPFKKYCSTHCLEKMKHVLNWHLLMLHCERIQFILPWFCMLGVQIAMRIVRNHVARLMN